MNTVFRRGTLCQWTFWILWKGWRLRSLPRRKTEGTALSQEGFAFFNFDLWQTDIWMKGHSLRDYCRHSVMMGRTPGGYQRNFSGSNFSSKVSETSTGATTARLAKQMIQNIQFTQSFPLLGFPCRTNQNLWNDVFFRVQSATMRELDEGNSIESLKGKNQKVRNHILWFNNPQMKMSWPGVWYPWQDWGDV